MHFTFSSRHLGLNAASQRYCESATTVGSSALKAPLAFSVCCNCNHVNLTLKPQKTQLKSTFLTSILHEAQQLLFLFFSCCYSFNHHVNSDLKVSNSE